MGLRTVLIKICRPRCLWVAEAVGEVESYHVVVILGLEAVGDLLETGIFADFALLNVLAFPVPVLGHLEASVASCSTQDTSMTKTHGPHLFALRWFE